MNLNANTAAALTETLRPLVEAAGGWSDAEWTHNVTDDGDACEGGNADTCETCRLAQKAADHARKRGDDALDFLASGDAEEALRLLGAASTEERQFGDDPSWSVPRKALRAELEALLLSAETAVDSVGSEVDEDAEDLGAEQAEALLDEAATALDAVGLQRSGDGGLLFERRANRLAVEDVAEAAQAIREATRAIERAS